MKGKNQALRWIRRKLRRAEAAEWLPTAEAVSVSNRLARRMAIPSGRCPGPGQVLFCS